ncbi:DUF3068 domain-containing protein [Corynebacterium pseudogenitalium]|uniref:DUF3068 domain-containing protein n=1 Tax=Corynebacterium pseudogenitalium TaxID=38303 RepID=UPI00210A2D3A|nr:DUF3068 domain-containing protein [Corynebacterium pseudogenitalium]MCQ4606799.1 DUF3068 domain-containing protein [Corynebacterium pseudogenitalium]
MLPKSRIIASLLAGLGIALLVGGLLAPRVLNSGAKLPLDLGAVTLTMADPDGTREGEPSPVVHQLHMEVQNPAGKDSASVRVGDTLRAGDAGTDFENLVGASTWTYTLNRDTGEAQGPAKVQLVMAMPAVDVPVEGSWLKLPSPVKQETYQVFDPVLRGAAPAEFVAEESVAGRTVLRFRQVIAPTNVAQRYADMRNTLTVEGEEGEPVRTFYTHSAQRELLVDQITGVVVGMQERVNDYYADVDGNEVQGIVSYDAAMDEQQTAELISLLDGAYGPSTQQAFTWSVLGLGGALTLIGLVGALWPRRR